MTTCPAGEPMLVSVVEAYRLDRYDNSVIILVTKPNRVVEAYRLDRYDNMCSLRTEHCCYVVEAYRLDRYDNDVFSVRLQAGQRL